MINTYASLHNHSEYSSAVLRFPDAIGHVSDYVKWSYENGLYGYAISDHQSVAGYVDLEQAIDEIKPERKFVHIFANEFYLISKEENDLINSETERPTYWHFMVYVKDKIGLKQMYELSSRAWLRSYTYHGLLRRPSFYNDFEEVVGNNKGHLLCSTACLGGRLPKYILSDDIKGALKFIDWCQSTFGKENFYLECQPCHDDNAEQIKVNKALWQMHTQFNVPIIITTDSHYMRPEDKLTHTTFLLSKDGGDGREPDKFYATTYLFTPTELRGILHVCFNDDQIDTLFQTTIDIADRIEPIRLQHKTKVPALPKIPEHQVKHYYKEYYDKYPNIKYYANSSNDHETYYYSEVEKGLYKYASTHDINLEEYLKEIDWEMEQVKGLGEIFDGECMADYFTVVQKNVDLIWSKGDSLVGIGRGSDGAYVTNMLLGITGIDPMLPENRDYFPPWRFCSTARSSSLFDADIDIQSFKKEQIIKAIKDYYGERRVCQVVTWGTLSAKTALERAGKGLGIPDDEIGYLKSLVPAKRGMIYSLDDCLYGNPKKDRDKVPEFIAQIDKYPNLLKIAKAFEGMKISAGVHAGALNILKDDFTETGAFMVAPSGAVTSQYNLHAAEYCGDLKLDLLSIDALECIRSCLDLLLDDGLIKWQGSLRATYDKYIGWDNLDFTTKEMWDLLPTMLNCFQFDSPVGKKALKQIGVNNLDELTLANGLMRLTMPSGEQPMEKYIRYRNDINEWYKDMTDYGLTDEEQAVFKRLLGRYCGMCISQETMMVCLMDKEVCGFSLKMADRARKAVAKKSAEALAETEKNLYEYGEKCGRSKKFLDYLWNVQIEMSKSYAFAACHSREYGTECLQELNLYYYYPKAYWNTAVITTQSQSDDERENASAAIDYGKIAQSIYKAWNNGIKVSSPDINEAKQSFAVAHDKKTIFYGLVAISGINSDISAQIITNRPYTSFADFYTRNTYPGSLVTASKIKQLVKAGCFDCFDPNRISVMKEYICLSTPLITSNNGQNLPAIIASKVSIPRNLSAPYRWLKYVCSKQFLYGNHPQYKTKKLYWLDNRALKYFNANLASSLTESVDYWQEDDRTIVVDKSLEKLLKPSMDALMQYINTPDFLDSYNSTRRKQAYMDFIDGIENVNLWSFDSCSFFSRDHVLAHVDYKAYNLSNYKELPEEPQFVERSFRGRSWKQYELSAICGIVLSRTDAHHVVTILTPENEVVNVKFNQGTFAWYKQQFSEVDNKGKKTVLDKSWFNRGTMIIVSGYRRGDEFVAKKYKNSVYQHQVALIESIDENNNLTIRSERYGRDEESTNEY